MPRQLSAAPRHKWTPPLPTVLEIWLNFLIKTCNFCPNFNQVLQDSCKPGNICVEDIFVFRLLWAKTTWRGCDSKPSSDERARFQGSRQHPWDYRLSVISSCSKETPWCVQLPSSLKRKNILMSCVTGDASVETPRICVPELSLANKLFTLLSYHLYPVFKGD